MQQLLVTNFSSSAALKAEIALAIKSVTSHISARAIETFPQLMQCILPGKEKAKQMQLQRTKLKYVVNHGLATHKKTSSFN